MGGVSVAKSDRGVADLCDLVGREQAQSVHQCQVGHGGMVALRRRAGFRYNHIVTMIPVRSVAAILFISAGLAAQTAPKAAEKGPQVKYNYLNVCSPDEAGSQELASALAKVPPAPKFIADFELSRGSTSLQGAASARYVRLRRELPADSVFSAALYSLSTDRKSVV